MNLKLVAKLSVYAFVTFLPVIAKATENDVNKQEVESAEVISEADAVLLNVNELSEIPEADLRTLLENGGFLKSDVKNDVAKPVCRGD